MKKLIILLPVFIFFACTDRKRSNPIDPANPETGGRPTGLRVISQENRVILSWDRIRVEGLVGYNIFRKSSRSPDFQKIYLSPPDSTTYVDAGLIFGVKYDYQLSVLTSSYESPSSEVVSITPGPTYNWVADTYNGQIVKLTHDGLHEIFRVGVIGYPWAISVNPQDGMAWVADGFAEVVYKISKEGKVLSTVYGFLNPIDVAVDNLSGSVWVADSWEGRVVKLTPEGQQVFAKAELKEPVSLSVDLRNGDCWVADYGSRKVVKISANGMDTLAAQVTFVSPQAVAVDSRDGSCWVADSSRVLTLNAEADSIREVTGFNFACNLAVNDSTGECWVIDIQWDWKLSKVILLTPEGEKILEKSGFTRPRSIAVNLFDGSCLVADTGNDRVVRVSPQGAILSEMGGFSNPSGVEVEN